MSDEIIKILDDLGQRFGIAIDWSSENVMPYLKDLMSRYIDYEVMTSIAWIVIGTILLIGGIVFTIVFIKNGCDCAPLISIGVAICGAVMIGVQVFDIITCYTIPEKVIIEYINSLLSSNR